MKDLADEKSRATYQKGQQKHRGDIYAGHSETEYTDNHRCCKETPWSIIRRTAPDDSSSFHKPGKYVQKTADGDSGQEERGEDTAVSTYRHQQCQEIPSGYAPQNQERISTILSQRILLQVQQEVFRIETLWQGYPGSYQPQYRFQVKSTDTDSLLITGML